MSRFLKNRLPNFDNIKVNRQRIIIALLIALLLFVFITTRVGSITENFENNGGNPEYRNDPEQANFPGIGDPSNYNFTGNPENLPSFSPPAGWEGGFDWDGELPSGSFPTGQLPTGSNPFPTGPNNPSWPTFNPPGNGPSLPTLPDGGGPKPTVPTGSPSPGNPGGTPSLPDRPNKAKNLPNMSDYDFIPSISVPNFDVNLNLSLDFAGIVFLSIMIASLYLQFLIIPRLFDNLEGGETEEGENGLFIKPVISSAELRRRKERQRRLLSFSNRVDNIIDTAKSMLNTNSAEEMIVYAYHELDKAFSDFSRLKRSKDITPLEHAKMQFDTTEINYYNLEQIVEIFYLVRFGHHSVDTSKTDQFIKLLSDLVVKDIFPE